MVAVVESIGPMPTGVAVVARRHDNDMPAEAAMGPEAIANASRAIPALSDMW